MLRDPAPDLLPCTGLPKDHSRQILPSNPQERLTKELRERTTWSGIFNRPALSSHRHLSGRLRLRSACAASASYPEKDPSSGRCVRLRRRDA